MERAAAMPTRNVNLSDELERFVAKKVKTSVAKTPVGFCAPG